MITHEIQFMSDLYLSNFVALPLTFIPCLCSTLNLDHLQAYVISFFFVVIEHYNLNVFAVLGFH